MTPQNIGRKALATAQRNIPAKLLIAFFSLCFISLFCFFKAFTPLYPLIQEESAATTRVTTPTGKPAMDHSRQGIVHREINPSLNIHTDAANNEISWRMSEAVSSADIVIVSATTGEVVKNAPSQSGTTLQCNIADLPAGTYVLRVHDLTSVYTGTFSKQS